MSPRQPRASTTWREGPQPDQRETGPSRVWSIPRQRPTTNGRAQFIGHPPFARVCPDRGPAGIVTGGPVTGRTESVLESPNPARIAHRSTLPVFHDMKAHDTLKRDVPDDEGEMPTAEGNNVGRPGAPSQVGLGCPKRRQARASGLEIGVQCESGLEASTREQERSALRGRLSQLPEELGVLGMAGDFAHSVDSSGCDAILRPHATGLGEALARSVRPNLVSIFWSNWSAPRLLGWGPTRARSASGKACSHCDRTR